MSSQPNCLLISNVWSNQPSNQVRFYTRTKQLWECGPGDVGTLPDWPTLEVSDWGTVDELSASATQKGTHGLGLETSKFTLATHLDVAKGLSVYLLISYIIYLFLRFQTFQMHLWLLWKHFFVCRHSAWESALESRIKAPFRKDCSCGCLDISWRDILGGLECGVVGTPKVQPQAAQECLGLQRFPGWKLR